MTNEERWTLFISELRAYIEEHHLGPSKHTSLRNQLVYFRRKMKDGTLDPERQRLFEELMAMRSGQHTGGRRKAEVVKG